MVRWYYYLLLFGVCAAAYWPGVSGPFVFDSLAALPGSMAIHINGSEFAQWMGAAGSSSTGPLGRPVAILSFAANHALLGELTPLSIKITNVLIHLCCGLLLLKLIQILANTRLLPSDWRDSERDFLVFLITALWLLHPLHVSTVLYAVQRMAQLAALFSLLALLFYCHARVAAVHATTKESQYRILANGILCALVFGLLATLSKENGLLVFWILVVIELTCFSTLTPVAEWRLRRLLYILAWAPVLLLLVFFFAEPLWLQNSFLSREFTMVERVLTQARILWYYLYWIWWPDLTQLGLHHDDIAVSSNLISPITTFIAVLAWLGVGLGCWLTRKAAPGIVFAVAWYLISHAMESTLAPLEMVYEHRNYLAGIGPILLLGAVVVRSLRWSKSVAMVASLGLLVLFAGQLAWRSSQWGDELLMTRHHLQSHPDSLRAQYDFANAHYRAATTRSGEVVDYEHLLASRAAYQVMIEREPQSLAALAALVWMDSIYFEGSEPLQWVDLLTVAMQEKHLVATDFNALTSLAGCAHYQVCVLDPSEYLAYLDILQTRHPDSGDIATRRAKFFRETLGQPLESVNISRQALLLWPQDLELHRELITAQLQGGDTGAALEAIRQLQAISGSVFLLNELRQMFAEKGSLHLVE